MSAIGTWVLETSLGARAKEPLVVALFDGDREVGVNGYRRLTLPAWRVRSDEATASVEFGPYAGQTDYDRYVLFAGAQRLDTIPETGRASLPPGYRWTFTFTFDIREARG